MATDVIFWLRVSAWAIVFVAILGVLLPLGCLFWLCGRRARYRRLVDLVPSGPAPMPPAGPAAVRSHKKRLHYARPDGHHFILIHPPTATANEISAALLRWHRHPELRLTAAEAISMLEAGAGCQCPGCKPG